MEIDLFYKIIGDWRNLWKLIEARESDAIEGSIAETDIFLLSCALGWFVANE